MTFGAALQQAREAQGHDLADVAARTRIRSEYLRAIEAEELGALPERALVRSYITTYARDLALDPAPLLADLEALYPDNAPPVQRSYLQTTEPARRGCGAALPTLLAVLLIGGAAAYSFWQSRAPKTTAKVPVEVEEPIAPVNVNLTVESLPGGAKVFLDNRELGRAPIRSFPTEARQGAVLRVEYGGRMPFKQNIDLRQGRHLKVRLMPLNMGASIMTDASTGQVQESLPVPVPKAPPAPVKGVTVSLSGASWLRATAPDGNVLYEGILGAGTTRTFPNGTTLRAGNAGAVKVSVDGGAAETMGPDGQALTRRY
ncbi:RodZ domain-containing protein [Deinococcus fonticola]|uniref:RodZ domain-containing protein n=1 Tax=Deinococcus fonticola TaxID=2528713 RepID=UPI00107554B0|nr:RodZ domain-containing protein [Deinococcus fonticola]